MKKEIALGLACLAMFSLTACGRQNKSHHYVSQQYRTKMIKKQVHRFNKKDWKLANVRFKPKKDLLVYYLYNKNNVRKVQDLSVQQDEQIRKDYHDKDLTPQVKMSKKRHPNIKEHKRILKRRRILRQRHWF